MMIDHSKMFSDRKWIKCVMFGKWAIRMLSPQLNAQAESIDFQILQNLIIQRMAENQAFSIDFQILQNRSSVSIRWKHVSACLVEKLFSSSLGPIS